MIQHRRFAKEASDHTGRSAEREMFIVIGQMRCAGGVSIFINILDPGEAWHEITARHSHQDSADIYIGLVSS